MAAPLPGHFNGQDQTILRQKYSMLNRGPLQAKIANYRLLAAKRAGVMRKDAVKQYRLRGSNGLPDSGVGASGNLGACQIDAPLECRSVLAEKMRSGTIEGHFRLPSLSNERQAANDGADWLVSLGPAVNDALIAKSLYDFRHHSNSGGTGVQ
jgi:hypothetical protein